jgi:hypothetical protein
MQPVAGSGFVQKRRGCHSRNLGLRSATRVAPRRQKQRDREAGWVEADAALPANLDARHASGCPLCWKQTGAQRAAFVTAGDLLRPGEELYSPPGQELLGVITSHGLFRESYRSIRK